MNWVPEKHRIKNNIDLISFKTEKFKTATLKLSMVSSMRRNAEEAALFSLMINVLRSGTEKFPEKEDLIKRLNDLYDASCSIAGYVSGDNRILEISAEFLDERFAGDESILDGVIEVMKEMLLHPRTDFNGYFRAEAVEREKKVICDKIKSEKNNSRDYAIRRCREIMCSDEPYGQMTEPEEIMAATSEKLTEFYKSFIKRSRITFSYVGRQNGEQLAHILSNAFESLEAGVDTQVLPLSCRSARVLTETVEELNIKQGVLVIGYRTNTLLGDSDAHVMPVFNNLFGGTYMSRLFKTLREKMSLCYYCSSDYVSTKAVMYVSCGIDTANYDKTLDEISRLLSELKEHPVTEDELKISKDLAIKELSEIRDYPSAIATFFYGRSIYDNRETPESITEKIGSVTADDVLALANKIEAETVFFLKGTRVTDESDTEGYDE